MGDYITKSIIGIIVLLIIGYGMIKGGKVYEWFVEGAKEGLQVCMRIFPYLLAMIVAVNIFKAANLLDVLNKVLSPLTNLISGAQGIFANLLQTYGPDTQIGLIASVIMGTTETIFYTVTVYFGAVKVKKVRHTVWAAVFADMVAIISAIFLVNIFFF